MSPSPRRTRLVGALGCGLLAGLLAGWIGACGVPGPDPAQPSGAAVQPGATAQPGAGPSGTGPSGAVPPSPQPAADGPCPYLDEAVVEAINGQRVGAVRISADRPYPACFFLRGDGTEQLRTWVVVATPEVARATVDAAVPVATSDLAELPGGWSGGSQSSSDGAVFAVARRGTAVVITTNQPHTLGAKRIAERVIASLGL
ncbi:MAG: DUF2020 domain-containing protein [Pseudonocardiaceae bacterium]